MWSYNYNYLCHSNDAYLSHHGILGQKWGIRRFQNPDGSLTPAGKRRYRVNSIDQINDDKTSEKIMRDLSKGISEFQTKQRKYSDKYFITNKEKYKEKAMKADSDRVSTAHQYFKYIDDIKKGKHGHNSVEISKKDISELKKLKKKSNELLKKRLEAENNENLTNEEFEKIYRDWVKSEDKALEYVANLVSKHYSKNIDMTDMWKHKVPNVDYQYILDKYFWNT